MFKRFLPLLIVFLLVFTSVPAFAADTGASASSVEQIYKNPVRFSDTITVGKDGGAFRVGFATIIFKKGFLPDSKLPVTFDVEINALDDRAGISFSPDVPDFEKNVKIFVDSYKGLLYDVSKGENIKVNVKKQVVVAKHFSRYAFR